MTKLPTLFLLNTLSIGGSERKTVRVVNALRQRDHDVHLGYLNGPETLKSEIDPRVPLVNLERHGKFSFSALSRLRAYVKMHNIGCIVCVNLYPLLYASMLRFTSGKKALSCIATVNSTEFLSIKGMLQMKVYAPLLKRCTKIIFGCIAQQLLWQKRYGIPLKKGMVIYNGIDEVHFSRKPENGLRQVGRVKNKLTDEVVVVGTVGQMRPEKRQIDLIQVVAKLIRSGANIKVLIVGDGPERQSIKDMVQKLGIHHNVIFTGQVNDVRESLSVMDIFVLPSKVETFSNAALEAMAMELPVILSDNGGAREMVEHNVNGFVFEAGNLIELERFLSIIIDDVELRKKIGCNSRSAILSRFCFDHMISQYEILLEHR